MRFVEPSGSLNQLASKVVEAGAEVYRCLGPGFLETVYEEALAVELARRRLTFERQVPVDVTYKGHRVGEGRVDLLVGNELVVELKAVEVLAPIHVAQVISYLRAFDRLLGLLLNFNAQPFRNGIRRIIVSPR